MDAREAKAWLEARLPKASKPNRKQSIPVELDESRTPMTDLQWQKLKTLSKVKFGRWDSDRRFVIHMVMAPYDYPITLKQASYIEIIWKRFSKQHQYELSPPRWICEYIEQLKTAHQSMTSYMFTEIRLFSDDAYTPVKDVDSPNTVEFMDVEDTSFWMEL